MKTAIPEGWVQFYNDLSSLTIQQRKTAAEMLHNMLKHHLGLKQDAIRTLLQWVYDPRAGPTKDLELVGWVDNFLRERGIRLDFFKPEECKAPEALFKLVYALDTNLVESCLAREYLAKALCPVVEVSDSTDIIDGDEHGDEGVFDSVMEKRDPRDPPTPSRSIVNDDQMVDSESELIRKSEYAHQGDPGGTTHPLNIKVEQKEAHSSSQEIELESLFEREIQTAASYLRWERISILNRSRLAFLGTTQIPEGQSAPVPDLLDRVQVILKGNAEGECFWSYRYSTDRTWVYKGSITGLVNANFKLIGAKEEPSPIVSHKFSGGSSEDHCGPAEKSKADPATGFLPKVSEDLLIDHLGPAKRAKLRQRSGTLKAAGHKLPEEKRKSETLSHPPSKKQKVQPHKKAGSVDENDIIVAWVKELTLALSENQKMTLIGLIETKVTPQVVLDVLKCYLEPLD